MTPEQFSRYCATRPAMLTAAIVRAEQQTARETVAAARRQSSGPLQPSDLRRMGHPYARRRPQNPPDPRVINAVTGRFRAAWTAQGPVTLSGTVRTVVFNGDPVARYMTGTVRMVNRDPRPAILAAVQPRRMVRLSAAVARALKP